MANHFVFSGAGGAATGADWANAFLTLIAATAAAGTGDDIYVSESHAETPPGDQAYVCAANIRIICVDDGGGGSSIGALATTATVNGSGTSGVDLTFTGGPVYIYGINFTTGSGTASMGLGTADQSAVELERCTITLGGTTATNGVNLGSSGTTDTGFIRTKKCTFTWAATTQGFGLRTKWVSIEDDWCAGATVPATIIEVIGGSASNLEAYGADASDIAGTLITGSPTVTFEGRLWGCKLHASVTVFSAATPYSGQVFLEDCASGDTHYNKAHYNYAGSTVAGTTVFPTGAAKFDGTNPVTWTIAGNANTSKAFPYVSPWIDDYNATLSSMTPYLEAVREGSATKYNDDEVWSEWMAKVTSGTVRATFFSERTIAGTATALESSALGAGDWTGENATAAFMKLRPDAAFTPAEIGGISARVCISGNHTIIVDPLIRY